MVATSMRLDIVAKKTEKIAPVRITAEAIQGARIASGYTGESVAEYVSRVIAERGQADAAEWHARLTAGRPAPPAPPKKAGK